MKVSLLTDAPKHNLALMKIAAWHKAQGDEVRLNMPLWKADRTYASILFEWNKDKFFADEYGGPAYGGVPRLPEKMQNGYLPEYRLFGLDYSVGYTFRVCFRKCPFCKVPILEPDDPKHYSIWDFHPHSFKKICLLNNNTFFDPQWRETFEEIWDADLTVIDENGYDLRLLDDEKADALHRTRWGTPLHFAWDRMEDESEIVKGLKLLEAHHLRTTSNGVYILIGYDTTEEEDFHRCQVIDDHGLTPYPMPYVFTDYTKRFKRFINLHYYRQAKTIEEAWKNYNGG
jgi:hypothetical protein